MKQCTGIILGLVVVICLIIAYMYRRSNFEIEPAVPSMKEITETPPPAPAPAPPAPVRLAPTRFPPPEPTVSSENKVQTYMVPESTTPPPAQEFVSKETYKPEVETTEFESAYEQDYAEYNAEEVPAPQ